MRLPPVGAGSGPLARCDPRITTLLFVATVAVIALLPFSEAARLPGLAIAPLAAVPFAGAPVTSLLLRTAAVLPFVAGIVLMAPFHADGWAVGGPIALFAAAKGIVAAFTLIVLTAGVPLPRLLTGLAGLGVPALPLRIVGVTLRYLETVADEAARMGRSAAARGYGARWMTQAGTVGAMIGSLLLRSHERGERLHRAMAARGGAEGASFPRLPRPAVGDALLLGIGATALLLLRWGDV